MVNGKYASVKMDAGEVSIHLHPLGVIAGEFFSNKPSLVVDGHPNPDELMFRQHKVNIILGYNGDLNDKNSKRVLHMRIYGNDVTDHRGGMTKESLDKILKTHKETKK